MKKLEPKQQRFVEEYLVDLNATQAYIRAGYSPKAANVCASQLIAKPNIQAAIAIGFKKLQERNEGLVDRVIDELKIVAFSDIKNFVAIDKDTGAIRAKGFEEMPDGSSRALQYVDENRAIKEDSDGNHVTVYDKVNFKMHDKMRALDLLGKHLGMFKERIEHSGTINSHLTVEVVRTK